MASKKDKTSKHQPLTPEQQALLAVRFNGRSGESLTRAERSALNKEAHQLERAAFIARKRRRLEALKKEVLTGEPATVDNVSTDRALPHTAYFIPNVDKPAHNQHNAPLESSNYGHCTVIATNSGGETSDPPSIVYTQHETLEGGYASTTQGVFEGVGGSKLVGGPGEVMGTEFTESQISTNSVSALIIPKSRAKQIRLPHDWGPRSYQVPVLSALDSGKRRAVTVWHRRCGKDSTAVNYTAKVAHQRIGTYWHVLPTQRQARKVVWEGIDKSGRKIIDQAFPHELRKRTRDDDMMIEFKCGSIWRLVGGDNYDSLVGSNVVGTVFSEWSIMDPNAWDYVRPILAENDGWAWFIYTPRGRNHGYRTYDLAKKNPNEWFCEVLTVGDTCAVSAEAIDAERRAGMPEELIQQEFYCSWDAALVGSIYGKQIERLEKDGRVGDFPYDPRLPVETAWDFGYNDATAVWFIQRDKGMLRVIDYHEASNKALPWHCAQVNAKPYAYNRHVAPHDVAVTEYGSGRTRKEIGAEHGIQFTTAPKLRIEEGIEATRTVIPMMAFDARNCARGLEALRQYRREWDREKQIFDQKPKHDWTSHASDALRTYAVTPRDQGMIPDWARNMAVGHISPNAQIGGFDPLAGWR